MRTVPTGPRQGPDRIGQTRSTTGAHVPPARVGLGRVSGPASQVGQHTSSSSSIDCANRMKNGSQRQRSSGRGGGVDSVPEISFPGSINNGSSTESVLIDRNQSIGLSIQLNQSLPPRPLSSEKREG